MQRIGRLLHRIRLFRLTTGNCGFKHVFKKPVGLRSFHKTVLLAKVLLLGKRFHQTECRVDSCMVQTLLGTEIDFPHIHGRYCKASTDRNKQQPRHQQQYT